MSINLAQKYPEPCCKPCDPEEERYPSFHYEGTEALDLPDSGTMTVKFKRVSESTYKNEGGKTRYSCTIELTEITSVNGKKPATAPTKSYDEAGDALDKLVAEKVKEQMEEGE